MSFNDMKVAELKEVAEMFGVDVSSATTKKTIIESLSEDGVTYAMYNAFANAEKVDIDGDSLAVFADKDVDYDESKDAILVKMDRANPFYQIGKYTFSAEHPFVAIPEDDAQQIFDNEEGFRVATPAEVKRYYS